MPRPPFTHLLADFAGVSADRLADRALVGGLVVAAASAAGLGADAAPVVRALPHGGLAAVLLLDGSHLLVHTFPSDGLLLLDVLVCGAARDPDRGAGRAAERAVDVFARRLGGAPARAVAHARG